MARGAGSRNSTISSATRRAALNNPKRFNFKFDGVGTAVAPGQFGRRNQYRKVANPETSTTNQQGAEQSSYITPADHPDSSQRYPSVSSPGSSDPHRTGR